ncbi:hypothetical protein R6Q57_004010 [Mikania cordata]
MAIENKESKWEGKSTAELKNLTAAQIWPLFEDFCTIHKWVPVLDSDKCRHVDGAYGEPGLTRYCAFTQQSSETLSNGADKAHIKWCNEKLLSMDPIQRTLSYEVTENNLGFKSYVGNVKVIETNDGCMIEWSFASDPVEGMKLEDLRGFLESNLKTVADGMGTYFSLKAKETKDAKWEGKSSAELIGIMANQLWPFFEDFCTIHKWVPALDSDKCCQLEGAYGEPGLIRYCVFTEQSSVALSNETGKVPAKWCNEKLLSMDRVQRTLSYEVTDNNLGFKSYVGYVKVFELDDGCKIEWSFASDPVEGMRLEDLRGFLESNLKTVAEGMRQELQAPAN